MYRLGADWIENCFPAINLRVLVDIDLNPSQQCVPGAEKGNRIPSCIGKSLDRKLKDVICETATRVLYPITGCPEQDRQ